MFGLVSPEGLGYAAVGAVVSLVCIAAGWGRAYFLGYRQAQEGGRNATKRLFRVEALAQNAINRPELFATTNEALEEILAAARGKVAP